MAANYDNVIIFGPTGAVGRSAALEASKRGAKVWLAMRDTSKQIDQIPPEVEKAGRFTRVQADLTDPASVTKAIEKSGTKAAYLYAVHGSSDHLRGTLRALKMPASSTSFSYRLVPSGRLSTSAPSRKRRPYPTAMPRSRLPWRRSGSLTSPR